MHHSVLADKSTSEGTIGKVYGDCTIEVWATNNIEGGLRTFIKDVNQQNDC